MSEAIPTSVAVAEGENLPHARSLLVGSRLMLAANTTLQLTFLFAYLYLRANNFGGMWRPDGVGTPALPVAVPLFVIPVVAAGMLWLARGAAGRTGERSAFSWIFSAALLVGLATVALRVYQLYHTGWSLDQGAYVDVSVVWLAALLALFIIGCLWMVSMLSGHLRKTVPVSRAQVQSVLEYWVFVTATAVGVFALLQYVA
jgi:hypothetical protein